MVDDAQDNAIGFELAKLLREAGKSVIVLEAGQVAGGASGRNAGHCIAGLRNTYHLAIEPEAGQRNHTVQQPVEALQQRAHPHAARATEALVR